MARKTIRARRLGKQIRALRDHAKLSQEDLCAAINTGQLGRSTVSQGQLSKVEAGSARLNAEQLSRILTTIGATEDIVTRLENLRARAEEPGWWQEYSPYIHETMEMIIELGEDASTIRTYQPTVIHGFLQTKDYARAVIESGQAWVRPTEVDMLVELRMRRQLRLTQPNFTGLTAVLTEATLRHQVGGPSVMRTQLATLCQITEDGTAAVHILPNEAGPWPGTGGFEIYSFPEDSDIVLLDGDLGAAVHEGREPINALTYTFNAALAKSLPPQKSLDLFRTAINELDRQ